MARRPILALALCCLLVAAGPAAALKGGKLLEVPVAQAAGAIAAVPGERGSLTRRMSRRGGLEGAEQEGGRERAAANGAFLGTPQ